MLKKQQTRTADANTKKKEEEQRKQIARRKKHNNTRHKKQRQSKHGAGAEQTEHKRSENGTETKNKLRKH